MRTDDDGLATDDTGQRHNDARLGPGGVAHEAGSRKRVAALRNSLLDALKEPLGGGDTVRGVEVAVVEGGVLRQLLLDPVGVDPLNDLLDGALVGGRVGERCRSEQTSGGSFDVLELGDIKEVSALLEDTISFSNQAKPNESRETQFPRGGIPVGKTHVNHLELLFFSDLDRLTGGHLEGEHRDSTLHRGRSRCRGGEGGHEGSRETHVDCLFLYCRVD